jgi:hypothetical protein
MRIPLSENKSLIFSQKTSALAGFDSSSVTFSAPDLRRNKEPNLSLSN